MRNYSKTKARPNAFLFFDDQEIPTEVQLKPKSWSTFLPVEGVHTIGQTIRTDAEPTT
jgi:hypothetical protein